MTTAWEDPRISRGMSAQLAYRRHHLNAGQKSLGWKLAFGGLAAMERLRIHAPLVGFLLQSAVVPSGSSISISGWAKPAAEPEIAIYLGKNLPGNSSRDDALEAICALGPAIEIADVHHPSEDVEGTLACNIYQRNVVLGRSDSYRGGNSPVGLDAAVFRNGSQIARAADPSSLTALTGDLLDNLLHIANLLHAFGETLRAGELLIAGSITPPLWVSPGEEVSFDLAPIDSISVRFSPIFNA
jgi:2-keto-4-pentenoate hydratase